MTITKVGIVYSKFQKVRRRVIKCDHDDHFQHHIKDLHPNEGWLEIPIKVYESFKGPEELNQYIAKQIGDPKSDECCVVCPVRGVLYNLHADPEIDMHPDGEVKYLKDVK